MRALLALFGMLILVSLQTVSAATPANLEGWRAWVLKDTEFRACPLIAGRNATAPGDFVCAWPGLLRIAADGQGASIEQRWRVEADSWIVLPGNAEHWPQQVMVNGQAMPAVDRGGPKLWLKTGQHDVRARYFWNERPQTLAVDASIALVALSVDGKPVTPLQREGDSLTLGRGATTAVEADSVDLMVFRKFSDGVPSELTTQIRISGSGQAREEVFGPALPEGFIPLELDSEEWSARLDEEGRLHVQVQPGSNVITLTARATSPMAQLTARFPADWASQEIWSYEAAPRLRVTHISAAVQVDPRQANVPNEWSGFPAYALGNGDVLSIEERSRGIDADMANRLNLQREAWLDFSGKGWFTRDQISGNMQKSWRLDVAAPYALQRASAGNGNEDSLLVTRGAQAGLSGVEWHVPSVNLSAGVRLDAGTGVLPITGWQQVFDQVTTTLHLPYGYRLIAAPGTDRANGSWLSRWSLLDVFVVAIIVLLAWRTLGWIGGVCAALYLVIGYQENGAPLWILLAALALSLILRALPIGKLANVAQGLRIAVMALLVLIALPFAAGQLRQALHPQLEASASSGFEPAYEQDVAYPTSAAAPPAPPPSKMSAPIVEEAAPMIEVSDASSLSRAAGARSSEKLESITVTGARIRQADLMSKYSESTIVQTGAGEPGWRIGNQYTLNWSGPVMPAQEVRLIVAPPWLVRFLRVALVALLGLLVWRLVRVMPWRFQPHSIGKLGATAILLLSFAFVPLASAQDYPSDSLLQQLRERLLEAPRCMPQCANIAQAQVTARGDDLRIVLDVHAAERVAVPLPSDDKALVVRSITMDGAALDTSVRIGGKLWVNVGRGVHRIELTYTALSDRVALAFAMKPYRVTFDGEAWQSSGLSDQQLMTETLTIVRARENSEAAASVSTQQFPPYVRLTRRIDFDLEWYVVNIVQRLAPSEGGFAVNLPIITGEHVTTAGLKLREGKVVVALADGDDEARWSSDLDKSETLVLTAPALADHAEVWRIVANPTWHVEFEGVPQSAITDNAMTDDYREFEFHPLPGETLTLRVTRPAAVEGATRAIDALRLRSEFGQRAASHVLQFDMRASQGGEQSLMLPAGAELLGVTRDGDALGARAIDGRLSLPIVPGLQKYEIRLRENTALGFHVSTPAMTLDLPAANIDLSITLPNDRWLLAAFGPAVGPAVLFWGELLVAIVLAWLLSRAWRGPMRLHHWLLLVLGFSTYSWIALGVVIVWLFALDWRARHAAMANWSFNLFQIGLAGLTAIALACLVASIKNGLLGAPDMVVSGGGSYAGNLNWFADRSLDALPVASVVSLPLWVYNVLMLIWALWLAWALVGWLRQGFSAWTSGGYWRTWRVAPVEPAVDVSNAAPPPPPPMS